MAPSNEGDFEYLIAPLFEGLKLIGIVLATRAFLYPADISDTDFNLFLVIRDGYVQMLKEQHHKQQQTEKHVFISYCHDNINEVESLYNDLKKAGITLWWDKDINAGDNINTEIRKALRKSYAVIFCFSGGLMERFKSGVYPELQLAIDEYCQLQPGKSNIIPILLSQCEVPDIKIGANEFLNELKFISLFPESERSESIKKLVQALDAHQDQI